MRSICSLVCALAALMPGTAPLGRGVRALGGAGFLQRLDLLLGVPGLREQLLRVLTECGGWQLDARRGPRELDREAELLDLPHLGLLIAHHHLALAHQFGLE